jgi:hypothetical protein
MLFEEGYYRDFYISDFKEANRSNIFTFLPKNAAKQLETMSDHIESTDRIFKNQKK